MSTAEDRGVATTQLEAHEGVFHREQQGSAPRDARHASRHDTVLRQYYYNAPIVSEASTARL
eukprot:5468453-Prymnesium_polylepis.1